MARDYGGSAFPQALTRDHEFVGSDGMSLRDYFAAKAPIPEEILAAAFERAATEYEALPKLARWCYSWADAMLAERRK